MLEIFMDMIALSFPVIRDISYFIAGYLVIIILFFNLPNVRLGDGKESAGVAVCLIIVWYWAFSKLIAL